MESENYVPEKTLNNLPKSIPLEALEVLIPKLKANICKIECNEGGSGTGFFCNIPSAWNDLKVLMTNHHVLKEDDILIGKKIKFSINNGIKCYEIEIDDSRKVYTNKQYDVTMIELKPKDNIDKNSFFDVDNRIFNENSKELFINQQIYLLHYPKGNKMEYSIGLIQNIGEDNYSIRHLCDSSSGSSGAPIINSINFQVIGIHKGAAQNGKNIILELFLKNLLKNLIVKKKIIKKNI